MVYTKDFWFYLLSLPASACAIGLHEYVRALVSFRQGDPLPKRRMRPNPFPHLDPLGLIVMLLTGYGWARPAPVNAAQYADRRRGALIMNAVPILASIITGCAAASVSHLYKILLLKSAAPFEGGVWNFNFALYRMLFLFARANLAVAFLNVLPVYPLGGNAILAAFLPPNDAVKLAALEKLTQLILLFALASGLISAVFEPMIRTLLKFAAI